jgi:hypothetical protein
VEKSSIKIAWERPDFRGNEHFGWETVKPHKNGGRNLANVGHFTSLHYRAKVVV